jgi:hypothetical protein
MSQLVTIAGRFRLRIPTTLDQELTSDSSVVSRSPEWMISIDKVCKSTVDSFEEYINLFGWISESSRFISGDLAGSLFTSGGIRNSNLVFMIPNGEHGPKIEQQLYEGKLVKNLTIVRLGWTEGVKQVLQKITFSNVRFVGFQQNIQYLVVFAQITSKENDIQVFKQEDGKAAGHKISSVDYSKNKLSLK